MKLPRHHVLYITHNEHKSYYETIAQFFDDRDVDASEFGSPEERGNIERGDELWEVHWYPDTPIGFYRKYAATLERALELASAVDDHR